MKRPFPESQDIPIFNEKQKVENGKLNPNHIPYHPPNHIHRKQHPTGRSTR